MQLNYQRFCESLSVYALEPRLLDPLLPELVARLVAQISLERANAAARFSARTEAALAFLKRLALICHYKLIASLLPHDVALLEPLLSALEAYTEIQNAVELVYPLQVWLYIVVKNPFDLARLSHSSSLSSSSTKTTPSLPGEDALSSRLIGVLKRLQADYNQDTSFNVYMNFLILIILNICHIYVLAINAQFSRPNRHTKR